MMPYKTKNYWKKNRAQMMNDANVAAKAAGATDEQIVAAWKAAGATDEQIATMAATAR